MKNDDYEKAIFIQKKKSERFQHNFLSKNSQYKKKILIQTSFIKKDSFDVALSCSKRLSGSRSYPNVKEPRESKMIGNKSKKKRNEIAMEDKDDD